MGKQKNVVALLAVLVVIVTLWGLKVTEPQPQCIAASSEYQLCALSEMAKFSDEQRPRFEHQNYAIESGAVILHSAKNETVASQWLIKGADRAGLRLKISDFSRAGVVSKTQPRVSQFLAHYHRVDRGAYSWGPDSKVLPWPASYPDALVPQQHFCSGQKTYSSIPDTAAEGESSLFWQDIYVPSDMPAGTYRAEVELLKAEQSLAKSSIELHVWPVTLPDETSIDAVGELYRSYRLEGAGEKPHTAEWRAMSHCYQQLAHAHRSTFLERDLVMPATEEQWRDYEAHYGSMLDGSLFSAEYGYSGTGENAPVSVWRMPWPQPYDVTLAGPLKPEALRRYTQQAQQWQARARQNHWDSTRWFAYVFDEVDGPEHTDPLYLAMAHRQMALVQEAIDTGTEAPIIDLLWTSHSDPSVWNDDPALDLRGKIRLWAPNAHAASPAFLAEQRKQGNRTWFYHSGHPAVGVHSINASGIELRTWGVIAARYGVDGVLMWAVNLGNDDKPFADPSYKPEDDRFGNGVLVYPGNQLDKIGFPKSPGAIPSIRLKNWRRGLQDFELARLAEQKNPSATAELLRGMVPQALAEGVGDAAWPSDSASWIDFKIELLRLASQ